MQELYDQRVLHTIVGVKPLPTVVKHVEVESDRKKTIQSPSSKRQAVDDAWEEMRRNREYPYDESSSSSRQQHHHHRVAANDVDEGGRYDIGRPPAKKRRKTGRAIDNHPVVFVDDDDEEEEERHGYYDDEEYYYSADDDDDRRRESNFDNHNSYPENPRNDRRRSYHWLSKGIQVGPGSVDEEYQFCLAQLDRK